jgi:hypothetical protein
MPLRKFRVVQPTIAISQVEGRGVAHTVNAGAILEVENGPLDGNKLVEVAWGGRTVMMFTQDLRQRAEPIE